MLVDISNQVYVNKAYKNVMNIILELRNGWNCIILMFRVLFKKNKDLLK